MNPLSRPRRTRPLVGVLCGALAVVPTSVAAASSPTQLVSQLTCRMLDHASVPLRADAGSDERRARLTVLADGGVDPAIAFLAGHNVGAPNTHDQNVAVGLLRRWRNSARATLRAPARAGHDDDALHRQELEARVTLTLGASAAASCPFTEFELGTPGTGQQLALAFEQARLVPPTRAVRLRREVTRLRAVIASMPPTTDAAVITEATSLANALTARGDSTDRPAAKRAAVTVDVGTQPFLLRALAVRQASRAVAIDTPPAGLVRVPDVRSLSPANAYAALRTAGLHLIVPVPLTRSSLISIGSVVAQSPAPTTLMPTGARVVVSVRPGAIGSPGVSTPIPTATVPTLTGRPIADAEVAVDALGLYHLTTFAPLTAAAHAADLLGNYMITAQDPAPGTVQALGVLAGGGFRPTPVHLWATLVK